MRFKSIQAKYVLLVMISIIASAILIGGVCVHNARENARSTAAQNMNLTCESYQNKFDASLSSVQKSVESCAAYATSRLESVERFATDEAYRDSYAAQLEEIMGFETQDLPGVMSYYIRFSPDLLSFETGFRYSRPAAGEAFERIPIVHIEDYQESDSEHVGWYYTPIERGETTWLEPYYNANANVYMISCVTPFYKDGTLVGVIGMDINFETLIDELQDLRIFQNGYAFLCSPAGEIYYHPLYEAGTFIQQDVTGFDAQLENESSGDALYSGVSKGQDIDYAFRSLTNGMRLVLRAPVAEIEARSNSMVNTIVALSAGIIAAAIAVTVVVCQRITKPLIELTAAAESISRGDYDVEIDVSSQDEVGTLARTLQTASVELKASAEHMRQLAFRDALTGIRNTQAYEQEVASIEERMAQGWTDFGIGVFDVNNLKTANDVYGHEQGNKIIKTACMRICKTFAHCPVFRVGGDEFVAVLQGEDLHNLEDRLHDFAVRTWQENEACKEPQDRVTVAVGYALYDPLVDTSVQDVFNRADAIMYQAKEAMKHELGQELR